MIYNWDYFNKIGDVIIRSHLPKEYLFFLDTENVSAISVFKSLSTNLSDYKLLYKQEQEYEIHFVYGGISFYVFNTDKI